MSWIRGYVQSSIGKKQIMAISGLLLCGFLVTHLAGNFLLMISNEAFNTYSHALITNPFIYVVETLLFLLFFIHIAFAIWVTFDNQKARPVKYFMKVPTGRGATFFSTTMPYTGFIVLVFLVLHLLHFKFGTVYWVEYQGVKMRDLHRLVMETFSSLLYVTWYVFAQVALGFHLSHGFSSAFATLGFNHPKYTPWLKKIGIFFALAMTVGYSSIPLWAYLQKGQ